MSPTIVLKDGKPVLVTGSPGGSRIISTVLQVIVNVLDYHMDVAAAVAAPRLHHQWLPDEVRVEHGFPDDVHRGAEGQGPYRDRTDRPDLGQFDRGDRPRDCSARPIRAPAARKRRANRPVRAAVADLPDDSIGDQRRICVPRASRPRGAEHKAGQKFSGETSIMSSTVEPSGSDRNRADRRHQPSRILSRHEPAGAADVLGLRGRLGARRHGFHDLSAGDRHHHRAVEGRSRHRRPRRHGDAAGFRHRRLARRLSGRPHRPGQNLAADDPVVLGVLAGLRRSCRISISC